jgi:hypothetical protein
VCILAVKKKSGQVSTCRIGPFPCEFDFTKRKKLFHFKLIHDQQTKDVIDDNSDVTRMLNIQF